MKRFIISVLLLFVILGGMELYERKAIAQPYPFTEEALKIQREEFAQRLEDHENERRVADYMVACRNWQRNWDHYKDNFVRPVPTVPTRLDLEYDLTLLLPTETYLKFTETNEPLTQQLCGPSDPLPPPALLPDVVDMGAPITNTNWRAAGPINTVPVGHTAQGPDGHTYTLVEFKGIFGQPVHVWERQ